MGLFIHYGAKSLLPLLLKKRLNMPAAADVGDKTEPRASEGVKNSIRLRSGKRINRFFTSSRQAVACCLSTIMD
jgi:hypothetical protein